MTWAWATCGISRRASRTLSRASSPDGCEFLLVFDDGDFDENNTFNDQRLVQAHAERGSGEEFRRAGRVVRPYARSQRALYLSGSRAGAAQRGQDPGSNCGTADVQPPVDGAGTDQDEQRNGADQRFQRVSRSTPRSPRRWSRSIRVACARCIGTPTPTNGNITSKGRHAWACSGLPARRALSISRPATSVTVPFAMGHYIENTGTTPLRFLEMFKSSYFADLSLDTVDGADSAGIAAGASEARSASDGRVAHEQGAGRAGLSSSLVAKHFHRTRRDLPIDTAALKQPA